MTIIPAGASNLDIRQYGFHEKRDGNILGMSSRKILKPIILQIALENGILLQFWKTGLSKTGLRTENF